MTDATVAGRRWPVGTPRGDVVRGWSEAARLWVARCGVAVSLATVAACAPATGDGASQNAAAAGSSADEQTGVSSSVASDCTKATKVAIVEKASSGTSGAYSFSPSKLTIQRGGFLAITNKSDAVHALASTPDAGIVTSVIDIKERQVIQFPKKGTFTVQGAAAAHRAVLRVTVSGESGCGAPKPTLAITDETTSTGGYSFTPTKLTVAATENFTVVNESGAAQTVTCTPDPGGNRDNSRLDNGETQILAIDKPGRYTCTSIQHRAAKVTITVKGA